jgi:hypothetical protein
MHLFNKLISHFIGNFVMWIYYGGTKSIDEVAKEDNSLIGFIFTIVFLLLLYFFNY